MSYAAHTLTTEDERERFYAARRTGGLCAACGRSLAPDETVYVERFAGGTSYAYGPVGAECASDEFLHDTRGQEPERCVGCGRGIYYRAPDSRRHQASCSRRCVSARAAKRRKAGA